MSEAFRLGLWGEGRIKEADAVKIVYWLDSLGSAAAPKKTDSERLAARQHVLSREPDESKDKALLLRYPAYLNWDSF